VSVLLARLGVVWSRAQLHDVTTWLNTSQDKALTMKGLRGKVVIVDFWTTRVSTANDRCRTSSVVQALRPVRTGNRWLHTPSSLSSTSVSNVKASPGAGRKYPIAVDNDYGTWNAYDNEYWPAEYSSTPRCRATRRFRRR